MLRKSGEGRPKVTVRFASDRPRTEGFNLCFLYVDLVVWAIPADSIPMEDFDLGTLGRNILLLVAILSVLVVAEMVLESAEEPVASVQQQAAYEAPRQE